MAEWSIAAVLKTVVLRGTRGSNPCLSAISIDNQWFIRIVSPSFIFDNVKLGGVFMGQSETLSILWKLSVVYFFFHV